MESESPKKPAPEQTASVVPPSAEQTPSTARSSTEFITILARWVLGGLFVFMGVSKAIHPEDFLKLVRQYEWVTNPFLLNSIAAALPWFEIYCGILLLAGVAVRGTALVVLGMLIPFTVLVFKRASEIAGQQGLLLCAVKFDCGCGSGEVVICNKIIENSGLVLVCIWLLFARGRRFCLRHTLR